MTPLRLAICIIGFAFLTAGAVVLIWSIQGSSVLPNITCLVFTITGTFISYLQLLFTAPLCRTKSHLNVYPSSGLAKNMRRRKSKKRNKYVR